MVSCNLVELSCKVFRKEKKKRFCPISVLLFPFLCRQIYDAGVNSDHLRDVRKAALESTKAAVRRLSVKCAQKSKSSRFSLKSKTSQKSKKGKKKGGRVTPEMGYITVNDCSASNFSLSFQCIITRTGHENLRK